jgi:streptogramin lyase
MPKMIEGAAGRRLALVIATGHYADPTLAKLRAPGADATDLAAVLEDAAVGGFEVETVLDAQAESLRRRIARFCARTGPTDLALVYLSCHGVLDDRGRLYYAATDTDRALLSATAVSSAWLNEQLEDCRCRRQILVLDCCHSGAFAKGAKGEGGLALRERFEGRGRVVLTGSRGTEYSFEHDRVVGDSASSVFTSALVQGLRSGEADRDGDGVVTVSELYDHAYEAVRAKETRQTPTLWTYGAEGDLLVAHSPRGAVVKPVPLPEDLAMLLESARPRVREGAVAELAELLTGPDPGRALTARQQLERIATADAPSVAAAARAALDTAPLADPPQPPRPATPSQPPPPADAGSPAVGAPPSPHRRRNLALAVAAAAAMIALALIAVAILSGEGETASGPEQFTVPGSPQGIAVGENAAWVTRFEAGRVSRIDPPAETQPARVGPHPTKIAAAEGSVWVAVDQGRQLARIDPDSGEAEEPIPAGDPIVELAIVQGKLWTSAAENGKGTVTARDLRSGKKLETYDAGEGFEGVFAVSEDAIWTAGADRDDSSIAVLNRVDLTSGAVEAIPFQAGSYFNGLAYGLGKVWIADAGHRNLVIAYDPDSGSRDDFEVRSGITADDIAVTTSGVVVWDPVEGRLTTVDLEGPRAPKSVPVRDYQRREDVNRLSSDLAVDGDFAWVTDPAAGIVYKAEYDRP